MCGKFSVILVLACLGFGKLSSGQNVYNFTCDLTPAKHDQVLQGAIGKLKQGIPLYGTTHTYMTVITVFIQVAYVALGAQIYTLGRMENGIIHSHGSSDTGFSMCTSAVYSGPVICR